MAIYEYIAKRLDGKSMKGRLQASDEEQVYHQLKVLGLYLTDVKEMKVKTRTRRFSSKLLMDFSAQISVMLNSGIPLIQAVNLLQQRETNTSLASIYRRLYHMLIRGHGFSESLEAQGGVFPTMMVNMFRAGEESGQLNDSAAKLAKFYEKEDRIKRKVTSALVYPAFLLITTLLSLLTMFIIVLPSFFELFETMESLPLSTRLLIDFSYYLTNNSLQAVIVSAAVLLIAVYLFQRPDIRYTLDRLFLKLPLIGKLMSVIATARFSGTLSSLYSNGLPLVRALQIASATMDNRFLEFQFKRVFQDVCNGVSLSRALLTVEGFDSRLITGIYIGEESGELDTMLDRIADSFDDMADESVKRLITLVEPMMIVILAWMIGYIMLSVMIPIYQYYQSIG